MNNGIGILHGCWCWDVNCESLIGVEGEEENDGELGDEDNVPGWGNVLTNAGSHMHAGRLAFVSSGQAAFNITINYKVALKG